MTGIIILAAGASTRFGSPKQNLIYNGQTLLQRAVECALSLHCEPVIVVLGANSEIIRPTIENKPITIVQNNQWAEGMASSVRAGINQLQKIDANISSVILMLCDQPFVDALLLKDIIIKKAETSAGILACAYNETIGVPVLFARKYFDELLLLTGQEGARKLLLQFKDLVVTVPFALGSVDIDTTDDYEKLK